MKPQPIIIIILCGLLIFLLLKYQENHKNNMKQISDLQILYKESLISQYKSWEIQQDSINDILLINTKFKKCKLFELLNDYNIIFYYTNKMCEPCVEKEIKILEEYMHSLGVQNIIIIGETTPQNLFKHLSANTWSCKTNLLEKSTSNENPIILLLHNKKILNACYTNKSSNNISRCFYENISRYLKQK